MKFSSWLEDIPLQKFKKDVRVNSETEKRQKKKKQNTMSPAIQKGKPILKAEIGNRSHLLD